MTSLYCKGLCTDQTSAYALHFDEESGATGSDVPAENCSASKAQASDSRTQRNNSTSIDEGDVGYLNLQASDHIEYANILAQSMMDPRLSYAAFSLRAVAVILVVAQAVMLNIVLVDHQGLPALTWLVSDLLVLFLWNFLIFRPDLYRRFVLTLPLPCGTSTTRKSNTAPYWFAWGVYSLFGVVLKLLAAFVVMGNRDVSIGNSEGDCLRFSLAVSVLIFVLIPTSYHLKDISQGTGSHIRQQHFFHSIFHLVVELIDCAEFMEFFVDERMNEHHSVEVVGGRNCSLRADLGAFGQTLNTVQAIGLLTVAIVFLVVTVELHNFLGTKWRHTGAGRTKRSRRRSWVMIGLVFSNTSFLVLRTVLWSIRRLAFSMLIVKNVLELFWLTWEAYWVIKN